MKIDIEKNFKKYINAFCVQQNNEKAIISSKKYLDTFRTEQNNEKKIISCKKYLDTFRAEQNNEKTITENETTTKNDNFLIENWSFLFNNDIFYLGNRLKTIKQQQYLKWKIYGTIRSFKTLHLGSRHEILTKKPYNDFIVELDKKYKMQETEAFLSQEKEKVKEKLYNIQKVIATNWEPYFFKNKDFAECNLITDIVLPLEEIAALFVQNRNIVEDFKKNFFNVKQESLIEDILEIIYPKDYKELKAKLEKDTEREEEKLIENFAKILFGESINLNYVLNVMKYGCDIISFRHKNEWGIIQCCNGLKSAKVQSETKKAHLLQKFLWDKRILLDRFFDKPHDFLCPNKWSEFVAKYKNDYNWLS